MSESINQSRYIYIYIYTGLADEMHALMFGAYFHILGHIIESVEQTLVLEVVVVAHCKEHKS